MDENNNQKLNNNKKIFTTTLIASILAITGIYAAVKLPPKVTPQKALIETQTIAVSSKVAGQVMNLHVQDDQKVEENGLLAEIDPKDYLAKLNQAETRLAGATVRMNSTKKLVMENSNKFNKAVQELTLVKSSLDSMEKDYQRYAAMYKEGIVTKQEYDNSLSKLTEAQAKYKVAEDKSNAANTVLASSKAGIKAIESEIKIAEKDITQAKLDLSNTKIYAPATGTVSSHSAKKGDFVQAAQPFIQISIVTKAKT